LSGIEITTPTNTLTDHFCKTAKPHGKGPQDFRRPWPLPVRQRQRRQGL